MALRNCACGVCNQYCAYALLAAPAPNWSCDRPISDPLLALSCRLRCGGRSVHSARSVGTASVGRQRVDVEPPPARLPWGGAVQAVRSALGSRGPRAARKMRAKCAGLARLCRLAALRRRPRPDRRLSGQ